MPRFMGVMGVACVAAASGVALAPVVGGTAIADAQVLRSAEGMRTQVQFGMRYAHFQPRAALGNVVTTDRRTGTARMLPARSFGMELGLDYPDRPIGLRVTVDRAVGVGFVARLDDCEPDEPYCAVEAEGPAWIVNAGPVYRPRDRTANVQPFVAAGFGFVRYAMAMSWCPPLGAPQPIPCPQLASSNGGKAHGSAHLAAGLDLRVGHALFTANTNFMVSRFRFGDPPVQGFELGRRYQLDQVMAFGVRLGVH